MMYGTTRNEAFHNQLKAFFRNVMHQTGRNAGNVCRVVTLSKLLAGAVGRSQLTRKVRETMRMSVASAMLRKSEYTFSPPLDIVVRANQKVDVDSLPASAKKLRSHTKAKRKAAEPLCAQGKSRWEQHVHSCIALGMALPFL